MLVMFKLVCIFLIYHIKCKLLKQKKHNIDGEKKVKKIIIPVTYQVYDIVLILFVFLLHSNFPYNVKNRPERYLLQFCVLV